MLRGLQSWRYADRDNVVTLAQLAKVIGVSTSTMSKIENETVSLRFRDAQALARYMKMPHCDALG